MIGLGGAEFRLPLLIGFFAFPALEAVILNKAMSLVVVASALPFRSGTVPFASVAGHWEVVINLLAGSLIGAWLGAGWATRIKSETLYKVIAVLLVMIAFVPSSVMMRVEPKPRCSAAQFGSRWVSYRAL